MKIEDIGKWMLYHPIISLILVAIAGILTFFFWKSILAIILFVIFVIITILAIVGVKSLGKREVFPSILKTILIIVIPIIMIISLAGVYKMVGIAEVNTDTQRARWQDHWQGGYHYVDGGFNVDFQGNADEIFNKVKYVAGWQKLSGGEHVGESLVVEGKYRYSGLFGGAMYEIQKYAYYIYWSDDGENWQLISSPDGAEPFIIGENPGWVSISYDYNSNDWAYFSAYSFAIKGTAKPYIKCEIHVHLAAGIGSHDLTASDIAIELPGTGTIQTLPDNDDTPYRFEAGIDTVHFKVKTEYSGLSTGEPDKGWNAILTNPNGNVIKTWNLSDNSQTTISWKIPSDAALGQYTITLRNQMNDYDTFDFAVIDKEEYGPSRPDIEFSKPAYKLGEHVDATISSNPNNITHSPISYFLVDVYYFDTGAYIYNDLKLNATNNQATLYFTPERGDVEITVKALAIDTSNRPSPYGWNSAYVYRETPYEWSGGAGEIFHFTIDRTFETTLLEGMNYKPIPNKIVYIISNPSHKVVYRYSSTPDVVKKISSGAIHDKWQVIDNSSFTVPAFPKKGEWLVTYTIEDSNIPYIWETKLATGTIPFRVYEGSIAMNLFAPVYLHIFMWWVKIPAFYGIMIVVALVISMAVFVYLYKGKVYHKHI